MLQVFLLKGQQASSHMSLRGPISIVPTKPELSSPFYNDRVNLDKICLVECALRKPQSRLFK